MIVRREDRDRDRGDRAIMWIVIAGIADREIAL